MYYFIVKLLLRAGIATVQMASGEEGTPQVLRVTVDKPVRAAANRSIYSAYNY
jgi:hypothetical protein